MFYALLGKVDSWVLAEKIHAENIVIAEEWQVIWELWPLWTLAFLGGVLAVLLLMKLASFGSAGADKTE
ncbi:hypothetical protein THMIRHAS_03120 [Thiosulfatimonas sediminis]|uniref:Uncharacterized protein n=1 Tax=Thiosulfatimonas sediminis TaxID=2675054 RepID=A0A6F8PS53_9GAMM|nr:hypothetical protein [Thiosulfatimonas sediminis]BBP44939.1 hypothetical protein THMIRHAS_03120 [Thiosulfatimonas sediminis]